MLSKKKKEFLVNFLNMNLSHELILVNNSNTAVPLTMVKSDTSSIPLAKNFLSSKFCFSYMLSFPFPTLEVT